MASWAATVSHPRRPAITGLRPARCLVCCVLLVACGFFRPTEPACAQSVSPADASAASKPVAVSTADQIARDPRMVMWRQVFFWSVVLLMVLLVGAVAIIRFSMRFRTLILRDESEPTDSADVWAMHRFPEKFEFGDDSEAGPAGPEKPV